MQECDDQHDSGYTPNNDKEIENACNYPEVKSFENRNLQPMASSSQTVSTPSKTTKEASFVGTVGCHDVTYKLFAGEINQHGTIRNRVQLLFPFSSLPPQRTVQLHELLMFDNLVILQHVHQSYKLRVIHGVQNILLAFRSHTHLTCRQIFVHKTSVHYYTN